MNGLQLNFLRLLALTVLSIGLFSEPAMPSNLVTGFCVNSQRTKVDREKVLDQLQAENVHLIRTRFPGKDWDIDFAKSAQERKIKIVLLMSPENPPGQSALSKADPELSRTNFRLLLNKLDESGVELAAMELGNEINWTGYNEDFPPSGKGKGKTFTYEELGTDPEGRQIAAGFLQYLKVLAVLKDVRDHSIVNRRTPILNGGLTDFNAEWPTPNMKRDAVTLAATVVFLRQHGLERLIDGYALHRYPRDKTPQARKERLEKAISVFERSGSGIHKPLWITEWGVENQDNGCPCKEDARYALVKETMTDLDELANSGHVAVAIYYRWDSFPPNNFDPASVVRCGQLTRSGKLVVR